MLYEYGKRTDSSGTVDLLVQFSLFHENTYTFEMKYAPRP